MLSLITWERGRPARMLLLMVVAELPRGFAGSHYVGSNRNGQTEGEPGRRSRSIQVEEMPEAVPVIVRAGRPRSQECQESLPPRGGVGETRAEPAVEPVGGQTRRPVSECRRCLGDVVRALKRFRRLSRPQFSFRLLRLPLQCGVIAPGSAGVPPACCSLSPGSAGVPPACCCLWWSLSFRAALQAATTWAVTATARPKESQGAAAGRSRWRRCPRPCQTLCGRDARAPRSAKNHSPLEGESARPGRSPQSSRWGGTPAP